ncbi:MAG: hypothetical protein ABFC63_02610 [Thermoguttaceae bacterium]
MATSNLRKAAIVLGSLSEKQAAKLLVQMTPVEAAAVRREVSAIGPVGRRRREIVLQEFAARAKTPPDQGKPPVSETASESRFEFLYGLQADDLAALLADEHPQAIALVLAHLPAECAAAALGAMPAELQSVLVRRIAAMNEPSDEIIRDLEDALRQRVHRGGIVGATIGMASMVKMLGAMTPARERQLLGNLAQSDPELLSDIRRAMFGQDVADCTTACEPAVA